MKIVGVGVWVIGEFVNRRLMCNITGLIWQKKGGIVFSW